MACFQSTSCLSFFSHQMDPHLINASIYVPNVFQLGFIYHQSASVCSCSRQRRERPAQVLLVPLLTGFITSDHYLTTVTIETVRNLRLIFVTLYRLSFWAPVHHIILLRGPPRCERLFILSFFLDVCASATWLFDFLHHQKYTRLRGIMRIV